MHLSRLILRRARSLGASSILAALAAAPIHADGVPALLDDFSAENLTSTGAARVVVDDAGIGGGSGATLKVHDGVLAVSGEHRPARGAPGFVSLVLLVAPDGAPRDLSGYEGVRLRVKPLRGHLSVQAVSAPIDNHDYHGAAVAAKAGEFHEVRIRFVDMRRTWSEQTPLDRSAITAISLVVVGMAPGPFAYEVDEVGFY